MAARRKKIEGGGVHLVPGARECSGGRVQGAPLIEVIVMTHTSDNRAAGVELTAHTHPSQRFDVRRIVANPSLKAMTASDDRRGVLLRGCVSKPARVSSQALELWVARCRAERGENTQAQASEGARLKT